jgi:polyisoprenoid-binding protein YceI
MLRSQFLATLATAAVLSAAPATYTIDATHSSVEFSVRHMMVSNVKGSFQKVTGTAIYDPNNLAASKLEASIDVNTINTNEPKRDAHLKSPDFFDAAKYPAMTFKSTKFTKAGSNLKVTGDLTIHGVTKPVTFDVETTPEVKDGYGKMRLGASATTRISRKDFGLTWNQMLEAGGVAVSDEVKLALDMAFVKN